MKQPLAIPLLLVIGLTSWLCGAMASDREVIDQPRVRGREAVWGNRNADQNDAKRDEFSSRLRPLHPVWEWVRHEGGTNWEGGWHVEVDGEGCIYVLGGFDRFTNFGTNVLTGFEGGSQFLARLDANGNLLWIRTPGGSGLLAPSEFHLDAAGNGYLLGTFSGEVIFGGHRLSSSGQALFIAQYDRMGRALWATKAETLEPGDWSFSSAVDRQGNIYVAGGFSSRIWFGRRMLAATGGNPDVFFAKFNRQGQVVWAGQSVTVEADWAQALAVDAGGDVFLTGTIQCPVAVTPDGEALDYVERTFLTRHDPRGNTVWTVHSDGNPGNSQGSSLAMDAAGNVFLAGAFRGCFELGGKVLVRESDGRGAYLAKVRPTGHVLWLRGAGQTEFDSLSEIVVVRNGTLYVAGQFRGHATLGRTELRSEDHPEAYVAMYGPEGEAVWAKQMRSANFSQPLRLELDRFDRVYLLGESCGTVLAGGPAAPRDGPEYPHLFLVSFDADGRLGWIEDLDGDTLRMWATFAVDHKGDCYLTGTFAESISFGTHALTARGNRDFFLAKYSPDMRPSRRQNVVLMP